jgi:hypothetical protein
MRVTWQILHASDGRLVTVECCPTLDDCIREMVLLTWEDPNHWLDVVVDDGLGEVVATGLFGPGSEQLVTCADGRRL